ncbi:MAG: hypothetical protein N2234_03635 [Planctomycetota bacterium]|nr:hypothetical protein [Planctomycetota bacterium]
MVRIESLPKCGSLLKKAVPAGVAKIKLIRIRGDTFRRKGLNISLDSATNDSAAKKKNLSSS